jgi:hypothetical protein
VAVAVDAPRVLGCEVHVLDLDRPVVGGMMDMGDSIQMQLMMKLMD